MLVSHFERGSEAVGRRRMARSAVQHALCLPELQDQLRGARAADVQLQQSLRRLPDVRRAGLARPVRSGPGAARPRACRWPSGAIAPWKMDTAAGRAAPSPAARTVCRPADSPRWKLPLAEWKPAALEQLLYGDGGEFPGLLIAVGKGICHGHATRPRGSGWKAFAAALCARHAAVRGCGPKPATCGSPAGRFTRSRRCRCQQAAEFFAASKSIPTISRSTSRWPAKSATGWRFSAKVGLGISHARSAGRHAQRRRIATRPAGHRHRLGAGRRVLYPRRALDRPASARQPAADRRPAATASAGQHACWWSSTTQAMMLAADQLIDIGPRRRPARRANRRPGNAARSLRRSRIRSPGDIFPGELQIPVPAVRRRVAKTRAIALEGVTTQQSEKRQRAVSARRVASA